MLEPTRRKFSPEEHAQLAALQQRQAGRDLDAALVASEIALRQWCVEQSVKANGEGPALMITDSQPLSALGSPQVVRFATVNLAQHIFDFITKPLKPEAPK